MILIVFSWFSNKRYYFFSRQIRIYSGFSSIFLTEYYQLYLKYNFLVIITLIFFIIILIEICERNTNLNILRNSLFGFFTPIGLLYITFSIKSGDTWFDGIGENSSTNFFGSIQDTQSLLYILIIILISLFAFKNQWFRFNFYFLFGTIVSSTIEMHYLASRMYELNQVNLWPRAKGITSPRNDSNTD